MTHDDTVQQEVVEGPATNRTVCGESITAIESKDNGSDQEVCNIYQWRINW